MARASAATKAAGAAVAVQNGVNKKRWRQARKGSNNNQAEVGPEKRREEKTSNCLRAKPRRVPINMYVAALFILYK